MWASDVRSTPPPTQQQVQAPTTPQVTPLPCKSGGVDLSSYRVLLSVGPMVRRPGEADHFRVTFDPACLCARTGRHRLVIFAGANRGGREEAMANADVQRRAAHLRSSHIGEQRPSQYATTLFEVTARSLNYITGCSAIAV